ncbi:MAG: hypothetical protein ACLTDV_02395 [Eubacterium sp.]
MWDGGDSLKTVKELVYDYDDYQDSPWLYGENGKLEVNSIKQQI